MIPKILTEMKNVGKHLRATHHLYFQTSFLRRTVGKNVFAGVPCKKLGKISAQPHTTLCIQFLDWENNDKNNRLPLGKQICFTIVWGCAEILPLTALDQRKNFEGLTLHLKVIRKARKNVRLFQENIKIFSWLLKMDKIPIQPHTFVKQICFPNGNVLFMSLFSLSENWMHNVVWIVRKFSSTCKQFKIFLVYIKLFSFGSFVFGHGLSFNRPLWLKIY